MSVLGSELSSNVEEAITTILKLYLFARGQHVLEAAPTKGW